MATKSFATSTVMDLIDLDQKSLLSVLIMDFSRDGRNGRADGLQLLLGRLCLILYSGSKKLIRRSE